MVQIKSIRNYADQILTDIESKTNQTTPAVPYAYNRLISNAVAAIVLQSQLHNVDQRKECFPQTASEEIGLPLWASLANRPRLQGVFAELQVTATGTNDIILGSFTTGPSWKADTGIIYNTKQGGRIQSGSVSISIVANVTGIEGNLNIGDTVSLTTPIAGVNAKATVTAINVTGSDEEEINEWRSAIVQKIAFPAEIGTAAWFYQKCLEVPGITRAYPYADQTYPGRVLLYAVADDNTDGQPSSAQLAAIEELFTTAGNNILWATGLLPSGDKRIEAFASPIDEYTIEITEGVPALSASIKTLIETGLHEYAETRDPYIKGLTTENAGMLEKVAVQAVIQNIIESNPQEIGRFTGATIDDGTGTEDYFTLEPGHRCKVVITYN